MVPVDLAYVIFIDFLALGVLRFCFLLLSNVQFLVLVNLPPGLATRVVVVSYRFVTWCRDCIVRGRGRRVFRVLLDHLVRDMGNVWWELTFVCHGERTIAPRGA